MSPAPTCPVCLSGQDVAWLLEKNGCQLHYCSVCDHIFVDPQPAPEQITSLYSSERGSGERPKPVFDSTSAVPRKFHRSLARITARVRTGQLLDVGCSNGAFLFLAKEAGFDVSGVELDPAAAAIARANGLAVVVGTLGEAGFAEASFDVVHLSDLIEHVPDPESLLREVRDLLRPSGILLVLTPNHDAFFPRATYRLYRLLGISWSHPTPPEHLHQFSRTSLGLMLRRAGFDTVEEHYYRCSLAYELRATGVYGELKRLVANRRFSGAIGQAAYGAVVGFLYTAVWLVDRLLPAKRVDFAMTVLAERGSHRRGMT